jgi:hypothetical protein
VQRTAATKMTTPMPPGPDGAVRTISPSKRQLQPDGGPRTSRQTTSPEKREGLAPPTRGRAAATSIGGAHRPPARGEGPQPPSRRRTSAGGSRPLGRGCGRRQGTVSGRSQRVWRGGGSNGTRRRGVEAAVEMTRGRPTRRNRAYLKGWSRIRSSGVFDRRRRVARTGRRCRQPQRRARVGGNGHPSSRNEGGGGAAKAQGRSR